MSRNTVVGITIHEIQSMLSNTIANRCGPAWLTLECVFGRMIRTTLRTKS